ncbi:MAG: hypothetical protein AAB699_03540 [Patescibacteria group bacterium]
MSLESVAVQKEETPEETERRGETRVPDAHPDLGPPTLEELAAESEELHKETLESLRIERAPDVPADIPKERERVASRLEKADARIAEEEARLRAAREGLGIAGASGSRQLERLKEAREELASEQATIEHAAELAEVFESLGDERQFSRDELHHIAEHGTRRGGKELTHKGGTPLDRSIARTLARLRLDGVTKLTWSQLDVLMDVAEVLLKEAWSRLKAFLGFGKKRL